eukprot:4478001-Pleurochrysis_carterae.AAC.1
MGLGAGMHELARTPSVPGRSLSCGPPMACGASASGVKAERPEIKMGGHMAGGVPQCSALPNQGGGGVGGGVGGVGVGGGMCGGRLGGLDGSQVNSQQAGSSRSLPHSSGVPAQPQRKSTLP